MNEHPEVRVTGKAAAPGKATGRAFLVNDAAIHRPVPHGAILVTRILHPHQAPLLARVGGIVTEEGSLLQHATTLARGVRRACGRRDPDRHDDRAGWRCDRGEWRPGLCGAPEREQRRERSVNPSPFVGFFDTDARRPTRLGGKGTSLCRLVRFGYRVPPGFVIPVQAFEQTCEALGLRDALNAINTALSASGDVALIGERVQARLREGRIPTDVLAPIQAAIDQLCLWQNNPHGILVAPRPRWRTVRRTPLPESLNRSRSPRRVLWSRPSAKYGHRSSLPVP